MERLQNKVDKELKDYAEQIKLEMQTEDPVYVLNRHTESYTLMLRFSEFIEYLDLDETTIELLLNKESLIDYLSNNWFDCDVYEDVDDIQNGFFQFIFDNIKDEEAVNIKSGKKLEETNQDY
jgi:hypothetical protein